MQHSAAQPSDSAGQPQEIALPLAHEPSWAALLLAWAAAFSDAIGFLVLQQLGASFMSGNSMAMGVALGRLEWPAVLQRGLPILTFFLSNLLGFLVLTQMRRSLIGQVWAIPGRIKLRGSQVYRVRLRGEHPRARDVCRGFGPLPRQSHLGELLS